MTAIEGTRLSRRRPGDQPDPFSLQRPDRSLSGFTQATGDHQHPYAYGDEAAFDTFTGSILIGNLFVTIGSTAEVKPETLAGLDASLEAKADHTPYPPLRTYTPVKDRIFGTQKFAAGPEAFKYALSQIENGAYKDLANEVGFKSGVETMMAKFQAGKEHATLLLLEYPTPQIAEQHLHHLADALPVAARQAGVDVERKASMLSLVFEASSKEYAQKLRDRVDYETEVTWNETGHAATDPPIVVILVKIIVYMLMFLGLTVGLGIAYGGMRIAISDCSPVRFLIAQKILKFCRWDCLARRSIRATCISAGCPHTSIKPETSTRKKASRGIGFARARQKNAAEWQEGLHCSRSPLRPSNGNCMKSVKFELVSNTVSNFGRVSYH